MFTPKWFYDFFFPIPEDKWQIRSFGWENGPNCAYGHIGWHFRNKDNIMSMTCDAWTEFTRIADKHSLNFAGVNDGNDKRYQQSTPKERILAALKDIMIAEGTWQEPNVYINITKDIANQPIVKEMPDLGKYSVLSLVK